MATDTQPSTTAVWDWLSHVPDPEIPVISVTDLGIVRDVAWDDETLVVTVTPTYSGCPATAIINLDIETALRARGLSNVRLKRQISPAWTTDWISPQGRDKLRAYGIAPPIDGTAADGRLIGRVNRMVGGNLRQAGPVAAAGIVALETMVDRLVEDHRTAKRLAEGLHRIDRDLADPAAVETNLVRVELGKTGQRAAEWSARLKDQRILVSPCDPYALRFVTHRHIGDAEVDATIDAFANLWRLR